MNRLKKILVGVDFSPCSRTALRQAVRLAEANSARLRVFHCVDANLVAESAWASCRSAAELGRELTQAARTALENTVAQTSAPSGTEIIVDCDVPVESVLRQNQHQQPDLLVLGLTGTSRTNPGAGLFATRCLRKIDTKVLLVSAAQRGAFRRVVACVDFSETSRTVVAQALRVAAQDESRVTFLHVFEPPWHRLGFRPQSPGESVAFANLYRQRLLHRLEEFTGPVPGRATMHCLVENSHRGRGIAEFARDKSANLIILGRRGLTNLKYVLMGSTAEYLAREFGRSILVVPPAPAEVRASIPAGGSGL